MVYKASKVIAQEDSCPGYNRTTLSTRGCWSKSNLTALSHAGGHGLLSPPASKARALERKLENWWKIKITLQIGFVGGFIMLRGSAVSHRLTGALLKQVVGWQRVGRGHWHRHAHTAAWEDKGKRSRCHSSGGYSVFCRTKHLSCPTDMKGRERASSWKHWNQSKMSGQEKRELHLTPVKIPRGSGAEDLEGAFHWITACTALQANICAFILLSRVTHPALLNVQPLCKVRKGFFFFFLRGCYCWIIIIAH